MAAQLVMITEIKISRSKLPSKKALTNLSERTKNWTSLAECPPLAAISVDTWININQTYNLAKCLQQTEIRKDKMINSLSQIECQLSAATSKNIWIVNQTFIRTKQVPTKSKQTFKPLTNVKTGSKRRIVTKANVKRKVGTKGRQAR